jgi:hypothetical protein
MLITIAIRLRQHGWLRLADTLLELDLLLSGRVACRIRKARAQRQSRPVECVLVEWTRP